MQVVELVRDLEEHSVALPGFALRGQSGPGCVLGGKLESWLVLGFGVEPSGNVVGEASIGQRLLEEGFEFGSDGKAIYLSRFFFRESGEGFALNEAALDGEEWSEFGVLGLKAAEFGFDAEELADEVFEIGRDFNDEFGVLFLSEGSRVFACGHEARVQRRRGGLKLLEKNGVKFDEAFAPVEIGEGESEWEGEGGRNRGGIPLLKYCIHGRPGEDLGVPNRSDG